MDHGLPASRVDQLALNVPNFLDSGRLWYVDGGQAVYVPSGCTITPRRDSSPLNDGAIELGGIAFITNSPVRAGQELFFDYEIPPSLRPEWYDEPAHS